MNFITVRTASHDMCVYNLNRESAQRLTLGDLQLNSELVCNCDLFDTAKVINILQLCYDSTITNQLQATAQ